MTDPESFYTGRKTILNSEMQTLLAKKKVLGWGRFITMLLFFGALYLTINVSLYYLVALLIILVCFVKLVYADVDNKNKISHTNYLLQVNTEELQALAGNYLHFEEGTSFIPNSHFYANDIDLFGRASLFQYINRTSSEMGSTILAAWLLTPATEVVIHERQQAVKELYSMPEWRQQLQAIGKAKKISNDTKFRLHGWMQEPAVFLNKKLWRVLEYLAPITVVTIIGLNIAGYLSNYFRNYVLLAAAILAYVISKRVVAIIGQLGKMAEELSVLSDSILLIEKTNFKTPLLQQLHSIYKIDKGFTSGELKALKNILARLEYRLNPVVFIPLAILFQWDLQQVIALEKWKQKNRHNINAWFDALGELEALNSLAIVHFNHPAWCFPQILPAHFAIAGKGVGHPLINALKRVNNYIDIKAPGEMMLITGSNMAGKSTYLRSIGINVVLAMAGSVVCAESFAVSVVQLITSMRISDNLEENTSTFYAELKKLKTVIEKVNNNEKVFILLDEILRGTNSLDRHTGSDALIRQLIRHKAVGIVATHDTDLAMLKEIYPDNILNFHFDARITNDELYFDYLLKEGVCNSINASLLMKKIGIEL